MRKFYLALLGLSLLTCEAQVQAQAPATPVPANFDVKRPQRPPGTRRYRLAHARKFIFPGVVEERGTRQIKVQAAQGGRSVNFDLDEKLKLPDSVKVGSRVVVDYSTSLESGHYRAVAVQLLDAKKKWPKAKGPALPTP